MNRLLSFLLAVLPCLASPAAVWFDGADDYITFGAATNCGGSNLTVSCRFMLRPGGVSVSTGSGGRTMFPLVMKLVGQSDGSNLDGNYALGVNSSGGAITADFESYATGSNHPVDGTTVIQSNRWYHAALTYDGAAYRIFLDGVLEGTTTTANYPRFDSIQHLGIGRALQSTGAASGAWRGYIEDVRVWDVALTPGQVRMLAAGVAQTLPRPRGWWPLNDWAPGDSANRVNGVRDWAGNTRGTITNGATWAAGLRPPIP